MTYFNVTHGLTNVWYQFWEEPDSPCFWTDTQANFLETWRHFVLGARSADPAARVGGPEPAGGPDSIKPGTSWAIMQSFIEFSAAEGIQPDFISYHLFGNAPEQNRRANRQVLDLLSANGFGPLPIIVGSWNPLDACYEPNQQRDDPSWPSPPVGARLLANRQRDGRELFVGLHGAPRRGRRGRLPGDVPARRRRLGRERGVPARLGAPHQQEQARPPEGHLITPRPSSAACRARSCPSSAAHANGADEYFPHVYALAGAEGDRLSVLLWSYVTSPGRQAVEVLRDMGYDSADFARWGGQTQIAAFLTGAIAVSALTSVASEQTDLERMKAVFYRQRALVTETSHVSLAIDGFASAGGYQVKRWLIDATHNNAYGAYVASGLNAAIAAEGLQQLDTQLVTDLSLIPDVDLAPYAVMLLEIERVAGTSGCASPSTVGAARLTLSKLQAPSGDDQLKLGGTVAVPPSPPIDLVAHGLRLILTTNPGVVLADLTAPAGSNWSVNRAGTAWKYRDRSASSGIVDAKVQCDQAGRHAAACS